jgi:hypothetical protein
MKIEITSPCMIGGVPHQAGEVFDLPDSIAYAVIATTRARIATAGAVQVESAAESVAPVAVEIRESALPSRRRRS